MNDMTQSTDMDGLYLRAAALVVREGKASTSFLQRSLAIGYNKAARLIERMEEAGIVSPADHVGKRTVASVTDIAAALSVIDGISSGGDREALLAALDQASDQIAGQALQSAHEAARVQQGKPPMKEDRDFLASAQRSFRASASELRQFVERIERFDAEKKDISDQQNEVMAEAKARGYSAKVIRKIIALRKRDADDIAEEEAILRMYKDALGMA